MRALLLVGLLILGSSSVWANECDISFEGDLKIENQTITINTQNHNHLVINQANELLVNGKIIVLSSAQQKLVSSYYAGIYAAAPQAAAIASDAMKLAAVAVNEVFTELLGSDNAAIDKVSDKLDDLSKKISSNFYDNNGKIRFYSGDFNNGDFVSQHWENEFEDAIEELVSNSIGHLMISIGTELLFSNGDMDAFTTKMERFGQDIEQRVEHQSAALEARANSLCRSLIEVDRVETDLQRAIPQLADLNILHIEENNQAM